jgi:hypothetical protein
MNSTTVQYLGFVVAAFILIWAVIEFNRRLYRRNKSHEDSRNNWVELDTKRQTSREDLLLQQAPIDEDDDVQSELHVRSKQNGHHAESQKPQI